MIDHHALQSQAERYFAPGSPDAIVWTRTNTLRNAIARVTNTLAVVSPEILYAPAPVVEMAPPAEPAPASPAGEAALAGAVSEVPEVPSDDHTLFDADPIHEISQEMFLDAARRDVQKAHQTEPTSPVSQEIINA